MTYAVYQNPRGSSDEIEAASFKKARSIARALVKSQKWPHAEIADERRRLAGFHLKDGKVVRYI